jgi:Tfp pilus assembly major pilin PilA
MVVVAIVGILAALAMGLYRGSLVRARIADGFSLLGPMKTAIAANLMVDRSGDACDGVVDTVVPVGSVTRMQCSDDGSVAKIHVEMASAAADAVFDLVSDRTAAPTWRCMADPTWPGYGYIPSTCKN